MKKLLLLTVAAGALLSIGAAASAAAPPVKATVMSVKLVEFRILPSRKTVPAGKVIFVIRNAGKVAHELVVIRTATSAGKLMKPGAKEADEKGAVGEVGDLQPGQQKKLTLTLRRGHYALICNLPGHYAAGQYADLSVR